MRWALFGPMPGSLPNSSIRSWTGPSNNSEPRLTQRVADAAGQRAQPALCQDGDLLGGVAECADDEILQCFDVVGINDLGVDRDGHHVAAAPDRDLHQT